MTNWKKYTKKATLVAARFNTPRLPKSVWAHELNIPLKNFDEFPEVVSWGQILRSQQETKK